MIDASGWFSEVYPHLGSAFSLKLKAKLHEEQTPAPWYRTVITSSITK